MKIAYWHNKELIWKEMGWLLLQKYLGTSNLSSNSAIHTDEDRDPVTNIVTDQRGHFDLGLIYEMYCTWKLRKIQPIFNNFGTQL